MNMIDDRNKLLHFCYKLFYCCIPGSPRPSSKPSSKPKKEVDTRIGQAALGSTLISSSAPDSGSTVGSNATPRSVSSALRLHFIRVLFDKTFLDFHEEKGTLLDFQALINLSRVNVSANELSHAYKNTIWKKFLQNLTQNKYIHNKIERLPQDHLLDVCELFYTFKISLDDLSSISGLSPLIQHGFYQKNYVPMRELAFSAIRSRLLIQGS